MTVYKWLASNDNIVVTFDKSIDRDYTEILKIKMDIDCECTAIINDDHTLTRFPITTTRTFYGDQIPNNDDDMLDILNQMRKNLITFFNNIKYQNK